MLKKYIVNNGIMSDERKQRLNKAMKKETAITPSLQLPLAQNGHELIDESKTFEISTITNRSYFENIQKL